MFRNYGHVRALSRILGVTAALFLYLLSSQLLAQGQEVRPRIQLFKTTTPPEIDGVLDDKVWQTAAVISNFRQIQPVLDAEPSERTEVYLAYDSNFIYVAFRAYDSDPDAIVATELRRDGELGANDHITIFFDTFSDRRNAFGFQINPLGSLGDARVENNQNWRREWNGIWYGDARIDEEGWTAEMAIPFKTLSFDPENDSWGLDIIRRIRRKNERMRWANISQNRNDIYAGAFGDMAGLENMEQGLGLDIRPTFSIQTTEDRPRMDSDQIVVTGGDITYRITPSLTAQATINTDFSDAPVDQVQNNLGRFSLFFPETRDFFLNDADIFQFGGLQQENGIPFFSRRMGIIDTGEALDLKFGAKITGRVGNLNLGVLNTRIEGKHELESKSLSVFRASLGIFSESRIGIIATDGDPNSNDNSSLLGADFQYRNSYVRGSNVLVADAWVQKSDNVGINDEDMAYGVKVEYPNDRVQLKSLFTEIQSNFQPKLGFVNRSGIRQFETSGRLRKRYDGSAPIRIIDWGFRYTRIEDTEGNLQSEDRIMKVIQLHNQVGDQIELNYIGNREILLSSFEISPGVVIPSGDYSYARQRLKLKATNGRALSGEFLYRWGDFYTGKIRETELKVEWRASPHFFAGLNYQYVNASLPEGDFDFTVTRVNLDFNLTTQLMIQNLVQHNSRSDTLSWNSRLRWEIEPGNEVFLVLNQGWEIEDGSYIPVNTDFTTKVRWTYRF